MSRYAFSEVSSILVSSIELVESSLFRNSPTYGSPYWLIRGYLNAQHSEVSSILVSLVDLVESSLSETRTHMGQYIGPHMGILTINNAFSEVSSILVSSCRFGREFTFQKFYFAL